MEKKLKQLLLKDLCARLPYNIIVHIRYDKGAPAYGKLTPLDIKWFQESKIKLILPYLRPMSSMTNEEINELINSYDLDYAAAYNEQIPIAAKMIDFFNSNHLDYRNFIKKSLALKAHEGMYNISDYIQDDAYAK